MVSATNVQSVAETLPAIIYREHSRKALNDAVEMPSQHVAFHHINVKYISFTLKMSESVFGRDMLSGAHVRG